MESLITYRIAVLRRCLLGLTIATAGFGVVACGGNNAVQQDAGVPSPDAAAPDASNPDAPAAANGQLRVLGAGPANGAIDIYIKGQTTAITSVAYGAAGALVTLPSGEYQFEVRNSGTPSTTSASYTSDAITVPANGVVTVMAAGVIGGATTSAFRLTGFVDPTTAVPAGKTHVRFANTIYSSPTIDVDLGDDGTVEISSLARYAASDAAGIDVPAGADLSIGLQDAAHAKLVTFVVPAAMLGDGKDLYLVPSGLTNLRSRDPRGTALLVLGAPGAGDPQTVHPDPVLYLLETSPDAGSVDGYRGADKLFNAVAFGKVASRSVHASATGYTLDVRPAGSAASTAPLGSFETGPVALGEQYLVVLTGLVTPTDPSVDPLALHVYHDQMEITATDQGRIRAVHAGVGVATIDAGLFAPGATGAFTAVADFASLAPGSASPVAGTTFTNLNIVTPGVRPTSDPTTVRKFASFANGLAGTDRIFGVLAGAWSPVGTQVPSKFILVKTAPAAWTTTILSLQ